jgi:hypothetical protein
MADRYKGTSLGGYDQGAIGKLPEKQTGRHRWIVITTYTITDGQAAAADAGARVNLDHENRIGIQVGCLDCEGEYHLIRTERCVAEAFDWASG